MSPITLRNELMIKINSGHIAVDQFPSWAAPRADLLICTKSLQKYRTNTRPLHIVYNDDKDDANV